MTAEPQRTALVSDHYFMPAGASNQSHGHCTICGQGPEVHHTQKNGRWQEALP